MRRVFERKFIDLILFLVFLPVSAVFWFFQLLFFWPAFLFGRRVYQNLVDLVYKLTVSFQRKEVIERVKRGACVLDVGSGNGYLAWKIAQKRRAKVKLVDVTCFNKTSLPFKIFDGVNLPFKDKTFDFVILSFVLHHAQAPEKLLKECRRVCRERLLVLEDEPLLGKDLFAGLHRFVYNLLYNLNGKVRYRSPLEWREVFKKCGFKVLEEDSSWGAGVVAPIKRRLFVLKPK